MVSYFVKFNIYYISLCECFQLKFENFVILLLFYMLKHIICISVLLWKHFPIHVYMYMFDKDILILQVTYITNNILVFPNLKT